MNGERYYTTKIWQRPSSIGFSSAGALSTSMDPPGEPVISTWKRPCQKIQNGSEFPELVAQNFRNPHQGSVTQCGCTPLRYLYSSMFVDFDRRKPRKDFRWKRQVCAIERIRR